ncbi:MAG: MGMT family protein [Lachnospiraceae bacterium]|nr:MGMT family protein [Lachnospiraceae bacterium]
MENSVLFLKRMAKERLMEATTNRIYEAVKRIPYGHVATYGQIAEMAGNRKMARVVGNALHKNPDQAGIPCYRVVDAKGRLAEHFAFGGKAAQQEKLEAEGILVSEGKVDLAKYQWKE